eukprot:8088647-Heterocapsa_arctica.AAC.1
MQTYARPAGEHNTTPYHTKYESYIQLKLKCVAGHRRTCVYGQWHPQHPSTALHHSPGNPITD